MIDMGVLSGQTVGRCLINQLRPEARERINAIFVGVFFIGGSIGSANTSGMFRAAGVWVVRSVWEGFSWDCWG